MISVFVSLEEHKDPYTKVKNEYDFDDTAIFEDKILISFGENYEPETTIVISRDVGFKLLDQLGVALTDDYTSLDHYIRLQEKEVAKRYQCPICDEWSDRRDFNFE